jgi:fumarate hydratase subunit beta
MKHLQLPLSRADVEGLELGEMVLVSGHMTMSIGLPTHQRMVDLLDAGRPLPVDLKDGAFMHLSCYNREREDGQGHEALYLNPTTSTRYNAHMPRLIEGCGLRLVGGKGGLDRASVEAMQRQGCVYLSFLGGGCTLLSRAIQRVTSVHWPEYIAQFRLLTLEMSELGPATVAIDAHGNSLYENLARQAQQRVLQARLAARTPD